MFRRASRRDTWRRGFRSQKCVKSAQKLVSLRPNPVDGARLSPVLCVPTFGVIFRPDAVFIRGIPWDSYSVPILVFTCSLVLCFSAFGCFLLKMLFLIEVFCGTRIRGRFFLEKYALSFCYVDLLAFSIEVYRPFKIYTSIWGVILGALVLCFPASGET